MYAQKDVAELAGYTSRVYTLLSTLHELNADIYQSLPRPPADVLPLSEPFYDLGNVHGKLLIGEREIEIKNTPIVAPAPGVAKGGEELVKSLSIKVLSGEHLMITGPVGSFTSFFGSCCHAYASFFIEWLWKNQYRSSAGGVVARLRRCCYQTCRWRYHVPSSTSVSKLGKFERPVSLHHVFFF